MSKLIKNLVVPLKKYKDNQGNEKTQWLTVGSVIETPEGKRMILIDRHINLAALPYKEGSTSVLLTALDPKQNNGKYQSSKPEPQQKQAKFEDDDIPF